MTNFVSRFVKDESGATAIEYGLIAALIALLWGAAMLAAFWWFEARYLRTFDERAAVFSGAELQLPAALSGPGEIRLVHFWDPACPCNVGNQQHLAELIAHYAPQGVQFHVVRKPGSQGRQVQTLRGKEHPLEDGARRRRMLQSTKNRATVIVEDNDLHVDIIVVVTSE